MENEEIPECELCGKEWYGQDNHSFSYDTACIELNKRCVDCFEEWGDEWPDRV